MRPRVITIAIVAMIAAFAWIIGPSPVSGQTPPLAMMVNPLSRMGSSRIWTDANCGCCHMMQAGFSHPVGVTPALSMPASLPLSEGRIACTTCHLDDSASHELARRNHTTMLRSELAGTNACNACHDQRGSTSRAAQHSSIGIAHLASSKKDMVGVDAGRTMTSQCLTCHDGLLSSDASVRPGIQLAGMGGPSHPVSITYRSGSIRASDNVRIQMASAVTLNPKIHLFNNQVECVTCHSPYSAEHNLLVMSNLHSQLCLSCHKE